MLLFLPYLLWLIAVPMTAILSASVVSKLLVGFSFIYAFGILFWGIPYTTFVIGMLFWSRNRSTKEIYSALSQSPLSLAFLTLAEFVILFLIIFLGERVSGEPSPIVNFIGGLFYIVIYWFMAMIGIFVYGYAFVFLGKAVYRKFEDLKWIKEEEVISSEIPSRGAESFMKHSKDSEE